MASITADIYSYLRIAAHMLADESTDPETIRLRAVRDLMPEPVRAACVNLSGSDIGKACADTERNGRTYRAFCLAMIELILKQDDWCLYRIANDHVESSVFGLSCPTSTRQPGNAASAVFMSRGRQHKFFVYFPQQDQGALTTAAENIAERDQNSFKQIAVLITRSVREMQIRGTAANAPAWKRGFFMAFDQIRERCAATCPDAYQRIGAPLPRSDSARVSSGDTTRQGIASFPARILANVIVGGKNSPYRKLRFEAPDLAGIVPPQFIMLATRPAGPVGGVREVSWQEFKTSFSKAPVTYLKRPFGIHRAFYNGFPADYLNRLCLPRRAATIMHTVTPDTFEVFYKVLPAGKGTREMHELKQDTVIDMIGPLGQPFNIRKLVDDGVREVHVIGGGVGMAPLIFLVQALRFCSVPVKAFIGIESLDRLRYRQKTGAPGIADDSFDPALHAAGGADVHMYVDDLKQTGVDRASIHVSYDKTGDIRGIVPPENHAQGLVSDLYARYLEKHAADKPVVAFACGPTPMMHAIHQITRQTNTRLYVLMEKRMACGIGVCLSCVCRTTTGRGGYSRVCKEGPLFDANEILWHEQTHS